MKTRPSLALAAAIVVLPLLSRSDEIPPSQQATPNLRLTLEDLRGLKGLESESPLAGLPAPTVPEGTKVTPEIEAAILLINARLIDPMREFSNRRVLMSRAIVRMDVQFHFAFNSASDSLLPFDVYQRHHRGGWEKIASGVCHPGMESIKLAMPETGVMVDPIKHPLFAAALMETKKPG